MKFKKRAFTFIELLIAVTIFSIIAVSIYSVFRIGVRLWYRTSPLIQTNQSVRLFFNTISSDLKNSIVYNQKEANFTGEGQKVSFMTLVDVASGDALPHAELARVIYYFDSSKKSVKRAVATRLEGFSEDYAKKEDILSGIEGGDFGFEYCYKEVSSPTEYTYEWKDAWPYEDVDKQNFPRGVRVKAGEYNLTIFIPTGSLGGDKDEIK